MTKVIKAQASKLDLEEEHIAGGWSPVVNGGISN